jgi:hypothetical protein
MTNAAIEHGRRDARLRRERGPAGGEQGLRLEASVDCVEGLNRWGGWNAVGAQGVTHRVEEERRGSRAERFERWGLRAEGYGVGVEGSGLRVEG